MCIAHTYGLSLVKDGLDANSAVVGHIARVPQKTTKMIKLRVSVPCVPKFVKLIQQRIDYFLLI